MADAEVIAKNVCQYWNPEEPARCKNWDGNGCTFRSKDPDGGDSIFAQYGPFCNLLGTKDVCAQYDGSGTQKLCILPDPHRHVVNRKTGKKWIDLPTTGPNGGVIGTIDFSPITEWNNGNCDGAGTAGKCTAYHSYHLAFSSIQPDDKEGSLGYDDTGMSVIDGTITPLSHVIYNLRARLGRCFWWAGDPETFTVDEDGIVNEIDFLCTNPDEITGNYQGFKWDNDLNMYRSPCNGAKPECPRYTSGICWQYCIDEKMRQGDKILAEQILEIRYYIKQEKWTEQEYKDSFRRPDLYGWLGAVSYTQNARHNLIEWTIPSRRAYLEFGSEVFEVLYSDEVLTKGMESSDHKRDYPDLVESLNELILAPVIKNKFDQVRDVNIFEVTSLTHEFIPIFGTMFYYNSLTYGLNLSDPDIEIPSGILSNLRASDSMQKIKVKLSEGDKQKANKSETFDKFYNKLDCLLNWMAFAMPDKMVPSVFGKLESLFYVEMPTFFGDNEIYIFNKGSGRWEFDKIKVKQLIATGVIGQTSFTLLGEGETSYLPAYDSDFNAYANENGEITFGFFPMTSKGSGSKLEADYAYNDSVRKRIPAVASVLPDKDTYDFSHKWYRIVIEATIVAMENMRFIGNSGYVLITIDDGKKQLSRVLRPWEVDGDIVLQFPDDTECKMEVYSEDNDKLEPNQIILKPEDVKDFKAPCPGTNIVFAKIYTYEKRGVNETSDGEEIWPPYLSEADNLIIYRGQGDIEQRGGNEFVLTGFGYESLTISVVFRGTNGRFKGQIKTKMITWIRQPYCRDVEIKYVWGARFNSYKLLPEFNAYGPTGVEPLDPGFGYYMPMCGDHDLSVRTGLGPMWYPYNDCEAIARYSVTGVLSEWAIHIMDPFVASAEGDPPTHGAHDMRMLGPADNTGVTCDTHASLWSCLLDWSFCNSIKQGQNIFSGYGRYRGGLSALARITATMVGGSLPKFGNTYRDFMRSYRAMDNVDYYYPSGSRHLRKRKWVPVPEFYTSSDITKPASEFPYKLYCTDDFYDEGAPFIHPMGLLLADNRIEGVDIGETVVDGERYHFEDVFRTHSSLVGVYYPYPKDLYLVGSNLVPLISWYTYKDDPEGGSNSIQWAWQEVWKDLERGTADISKVSCPDVIDVCCTESSLEFGGCLYSSPYYAEECDVDLYGRHLFFDLQHPDYKYDALLAEHRLVSEEGQYDFFVRTPDFKIVAGGIREYFWATLGSGPYRAFDLDGSWNPGHSEDIHPWDDDETNEWYVLYNTCTQSPWVEEVTLFATTTAPPYVAETEESAELDGRMIKTYDDVGDEVKTYYQRGVSAPFDTDLMDYIARKKEILPPLNYEIGFSKRPSSSSSLFAGITPNTLYPAENRVDMNYVSSTGLLKITMLAHRLSVCNAAIDTSIMVEDPLVFDSGIGLPTGSECTFKYGSISVTDKLIKLYHIPAVVEIRVDGVVKYSCNNMTMALPGTEITTRKCNYPWDVTSVELFDFKKEEADLRESMLSSGGSATCGDATITGNTTLIEVTLRLLPTVDESKEVTAAIEALEKELIKQGRLDKGENIEVEQYVSIQDIYLHHSNFVDSIEQITIHERKYYISTGSHGDIPPHGTDSTGSLLYVNPKDLSSVYQMDNPGGMTGAPNSGGDFKSMNKCRGRLVFEVHEDKERLDIGQGGSTAWLRKAEKEQKKIHDAIINEGEPGFTMKSVVLPGIEDKLEETGTTYSSWTCSFTNSIVLPLQAVIARGTYSPKGQKFVHSWSTAIKVSNCGARGSISHRSAEDVFEYAYTDIATGTGFGTMDPLVAYTRGTAQVLIAPFSYIGPTVYNAEAAQLRALEPLSLPDPVSSLT